MIKSIAIVSLSRGVLGEAFAQHEVEIGLQRLAGYDVNVRFMPNARRGIDYLTAHPEARAADLLQAFRDPEIDMILCAIGGDDTYRLAPYLFANGELETAVSGTDKIFLGFSDTTVNHMMLHKVGVKTFYGQSFLSDVCELGGEMLPYTCRYFEELIQTGTIRAVTPSDTWYEARTDFHRSRPACRSRRTRIPALSFCREDPAFPVRSSAGVSIRSSTSSTAGGMPICRRCVKSTASSQARRTGRGGSF